MKCIYCGAELRGNTYCEYCGTDYGKVHKFSAEFSDMNHKGTITIHGHTYKAYISGITVDCEQYVARNISGRMYTARGPMHRVITLVTYEE